MAGPFALAARLAQAALIAAGFSVAGSALAQEPISVTVDFAKLLKMPPGTVTLVIGNPAIADVAVQRNQLMVVTGRSYGRTNLIALDAAGGVISESIVVVGIADEGRLVVQRGANSESWSCNPTCVPGLAIGDNNAVFGVLKSQIEAREQLARGKAAAEKKDEKE